MAGFNQYKGKMLPYLLTTGDLANGLNQLASANLKLKDGVTNYTNGVSALTTSMTTGEPVRCWNTCS